MRGTDMIFSRGDGPKMLRKSRDFIKAFIRYDKLRVRRLRIKFNGVDEWR